ncbi:MAG: TlpA family protein disulfide reductase [Bacteroidales bacterium]|nr:TlpA family protein disulfide reductase [Bacteroidales bacterium]
MNMHKIIHFFVLILGIFNFSFCQNSNNSGKFTLEINFDRKPKEKYVYFWKIRGFEEEIIDSIPISGFKAILTRDTIPETGEYRISTSLNDDGWYIIIHRESTIQLRITTNNKLIIRNSQENSLYSYLQRFQDKLDSLETRGNYYYQTGRYDQLVQVKENIKRLLHNYTRVLDSMKQLYPQSFAVKVQYASIPPLFDDYKKKNPDHGYRNEYHFLQRRLFDRIDKQDSSLVNTRVIARAVEFYLNNLLDSATEENYKKACDFILSTFSWNNTQFNFVLHLLMNTFEDSPFEGVYLHLYDLYYHHSNCEGGIPDAYERRAFSLRNLKPGMQAPVLEGLDPNGNKVSLSDYLGKKVLIIFWNSQCEHCHHQLPEVLSYVETIPDLVVLSFSLDEDKDAWVKGIRELHLPMPSITDLKGYEGENAIRWAVFGTPLFFVVDFEGKIIAKPKNMDELKKSLK